MFLEKFLGVLAEPHTLSIFFKLFLDNWLNYAKALLIAWVALIGCEIFFRAEKQSLKCYFEGIKAWVALTLVYSLLISAFILISPHLRFSPLIVIHLPKGLVWLSPLVSLLVSDFFYYWMHRGQHSKFLWRFHRYHHSHRELNVVNCSHHVIEPVINLVCITIPLIFFPVPIEGTLPIFALLPFWAYFVHANTKIHFGKFNLLFADPRYHRVHHSIDKKHFGKNYAVYVPFLGHRIWHGLLS